MIKADFWEIEDALEDLARAEAWPNHRQIALSGSVQRVWWSIRCFDGSRMVIQSATYKDTTSSPVHFKLIIIAMNYYFYYYNFVISGISTISSIYVFPR